MAESKQMLAPRLTEEEIAEALALVARLEALQAEQLEERGGVPFPDSTDLIHQMRDDRTEDQRLLNALGGRLAIVQALHSYRARS